MKIGDWVRLNDQGKESWKNNPEKQWVPQTTVWEIVGGGGFDQYGRRVKLRALHDDAQPNNESIDEYNCYYEHCLQVVELPDTKKKENNGCYWCNCKGSRTRPVDGIDFRGAVYGMLAVCQVVQDEKQ